MCGFQSTAMGRKAFWDVRRLARFARFSPVPILLALSLTSACAGLGSSPGEIADNNGGTDAQISQAMRMADAVRTSGDMSAAAVFYPRPGGLALVR